MVMDRIFYTKAEAGPAWLGIHCALDFFLANCLAPLPRFIELTEHCALDFGLSNYLKTWFDRLTTNG